MYIWERRVTDDGRNDEDQSWDEQRGEGAMVFSVLAFAEAELSWSLVSVLDVSATSTER